MKIGWGRGGYLQRSGKINSRRRSDMSLSTDFKNIENKIIKDKIR